jgi:hypothetical protein
MKTKTLQQIGFWGFVISFNILGAYSAFSVGYNVLGAAIVVLVVLSIACVGVTKLYES